MIIDARKCFETPHGRPFTVSAAVANALDLIEVGASLQIDAMFDQIGNDVPRRHLDAMVNKHRGYRRFTVRAAGAGAVATITRIV